MTLGKELIDIPELQKQHPHLAPIPPIVYNYSDIQLIIGQDAYYAIHPINAFKGDPMNDPWAVQLPLGWALCGATPERTSASFVSTCFKATVEDLSLAEQVKAWYDLESYGSCVQADPRSAADNVYDSFLWREDPTQNVETLQYTRHIFGARDSPTCANFALQQTARDNEATYPLAAKAVQQEFYMDDYLDSVECPETALKLSQELIEMLKLGDFKLTKFISNVNDLSETLEPSVPVPQVKEIVQHPTITSHVLGLRWDHKADTLNVSRGVKLKENRPNTQRTVLSTVSAVFDPLGIVAPFTVVARVLLKDIWKLKGQQWDDPLPEDLSRRFDDWCSGLPLLQDLTIPRAYFSSPVEEIELHMFGDCSKDIFCAVGFLRAKCQGSNIAHLSFVVGKARVAPMKPITIPKLELQAALLAAHLRQKILGALTFDVPQSFMWTDSSTVLQWLASADKQPVFVANRVAEILETTTIDQWFHVPTANNPADAGTRGIAAADLPSCCWVKGPNFLKTSDGRLNRNHLPFTLLNQRKRVQLTNYSPTHWRQRRRLTPPS